MSIPPSVPDQPVLPSPIDPGSPPDQPPQRYSVLSNKAVGWAALTLIVLGTGLAVWLLLAFGNGQHTDQLDAIKTAGTIVVGAGGAAALWLTARRQQTSEIALNQKHLDQLAVERAFAFQQQQAADQRAHLDRVAVATENDAKARRINDLYAKAVEQLGSDKAPVRLGGLYALERLAQDNAELRETVVDVLCAYLRMAYTTPLPTQRPGVSSRYGGVTRAHRHRSHAQRRLYLALSDANSTRKPERPQQDENRNREAELEREVRLTAQRLLRDHLRPTLNDSSTPDPKYWGQCDLDLFGATLLNFDFTDCRPNTAQFSGARFEGTAWFDGVQFDGHARFDGVRFSGDARFRGVRFDSDARFDGVRFSGDSWFAGAQFSGDTGFDGAGFDGDTTFRGVRFSGDTGFSEAHFGGDARVSEARFDGSAWFDGVQFDGTAWFDGVQFDGDAGFDDARFDGDAEFKGARFNGTAGFEEARFSGGAGFDDARFDGDAEFKGARFNGTAGFAGAQFSGTVRFRETRFSRSPWFYDARFGGDAWFAEAWFSGGAWFSEARFDGTAWFAGAQVSDIFGEAWVRLDGADDVRRYRAWPAGYAVRTVEDMPGNCTEGAWGRLFKQAAGSG